MSMHITKEECFQTAAKGASNLVSSIKFSLTHKIFLAASSDVVIYFIESDEYFFSHTHPHCHFYSCSAQHRNSPGLGFCFICLTEGASATSVSN